MGTITKDKFINVLREKSPPSLITELLTRFPIRLHQLLLEKQRRLRRGPKLFYGYKEEDGFLIAEPRKATFDFLYLVYKGARSGNNLELLHLDRGGLEPKSLGGYVRKFADDKFFRFCQNQGVI